jgi:hypothetical protein
MSERAKVLIDEHRWPTVYVSWPGEPLEDEDFEAMLAEMAKLTQRRKPFVIIHDARRAVRPTPKQRGLAAAQQDSDAAESKKWLRGAALVVSNPLIAGVATAVNWLSPSPFPTKFFSSMTDAEAWAAAQLQRKDGA